MSFEFAPDEILRFTPWTEIDWLIHGFSTRRAGDFTRPGPADAAARFGAPEAKLVTLRQVHSDLVHSAAEEGAADRKGDALYSNKGGTLVGVRTADCLPLLLLDRERRRVAAVHAGWRGSARRIAARTVEALLAAGSPPESLEAVIGPCIGVERYEVGREVAERFCDGAVIEDRRWLKPHLDLTAANRLQLLQAGVPDRAIHIAGLCTYEGAERFHSYRRDGERSGRMLAVIGLR